MSSYWQELCAASSARPLQQLLDDLFAIGGVLVPLSPQTSIVLLRFTLTRLSGILFHRLRCRPVLGVCFVAKAKRACEQRMAAVRVVYQAVLPRQRVWSDSLWRKDWQFVADIFFEENGAAGESYSVSIADH